MDDRQLKVNEYAYEMNKKKGFFELGPSKKFEILDDLKRFSFFLCRYKFISKLFLYEKKMRILELGCSEALGSLILKQENDIKEYVGIDFDEEAIEWSKKNLPDKSKYFTADIFNIPDEVAKGEYDLVFSLDVIEHIDRIREDNFVKVMSSHVKQKGGCVIIGTPNISMDPYACEASKIGHINLYSQKRLHDLCKKYFDNVMMFGMNDEIVNVGFEPMTCYMFAVCTGKKDI